MSVASIPSPARAAMRVSRDEWIMRLGVMLLVACLLLAIALPLWALLSKSFQNAGGQFIGLANYIRYFSTPTLYGSIVNSVGIAAITTAIVIPLAFTYAYALTRSRMRFKGLFYAGALLP